MISVDKPNRRAVSSAKGNATDIGMTPVPPALNSLWWDQRSQQVWRVESYNALRKNVVNMVCGTNRVQMPLTLLYACAEDGPRFVAVAALSPQMQAGIQDPALALEVQRFTRHRDLNQVPAPMLDAVKAYVSRSWLVGPSGRAGTK